MWVIIIIDTINDEKSTEIIVCKNYKNVKKQLNRLKKEFKGYDLINKSDYIYINMDENDIVEIKAFKIEFNEQIHV